MKYGYDRCTRECYAAYLGVAKENLGLRGLFVDIPEPKSGTRYWRNQVACAGFAMANGNLEGVFSKTGGQLGKIVDCVEGIAQRDGLVIVTLDCFEPLVPVWERHGFKVEHYVPGDYKYAPECWDYDQLGTPRVAYMSKFVQTT